MFGLFADRFGRCGLSGVVAPIAMACVIGILLGSSADTARASACSCPNVGDINADGSFNVLDLVLILDAVIGNGPIDQDPDCPKARPDFNADGSIDIRDVMACVDTIFHGGGTAQDPCACVSNPSLCNPATDPNPGAPGNSVVVQSLTVFTNETGVRIPVFLTNDVQLRSLVVPLVVREITPGSFITSVEVAFEDRLVSALGDIRQANRYSAPDGTCPNGFATGSTLTEGIPQPVASSPEGLAFFSATVASNDYLDPGSDMTGSLVLTVDVTGTPGTFEIDTTCSDPANHLMFVQNNSPANSPIVPAFTKGIITLATNAPPVAQCQNVAVSTGAGCEGEASINNGSYDPEGHPVILTQTPPGPYPVGSTLVTLTVEDDMGATGSCQATVTVEDLTPPQIVCPDDIFVNVPPVHTGAVLTYEVTATDDCPGEVTIVGSMPSGGFFPVGVTEVTCTATDASGNTADCSFFVTVEAVCYDRLTDVNCDGFTTAEDLAMLIDILYFGAPSAPPCTSAP